VELEFMDWGYGALASSYVPDDQEVLLKVD
jgi:hypothetical protein